MSAHATPKPQITHFEVDGEPFETAEKRLTPNQILGIAGVDPANHYLVELKGRHQTSYKDEPDKPIRVQDGDRFISVATGPTPVS